MIAKIAQFNPDPEELERLKQKRACPMIYGQFTNWKPVKMWDIREYCDKINSDKPNIFDQCKERAIIPDKFDKVEELPPELLEKYQREVRF